MTDTVTQGIRVKVTPAFWPERSLPHQGQYAFTYHIVISNEGETPARLRARHWVISDATGHLEEVRGDGVVGKQPLLHSGERFEYTSWAMLRTPYGSMRGEYIMQRPDGTEFDAIIGEFALTQPNALH